MSQFPLAHTRNLGRRHSLLRTLGQKVRAVFLVVSFRLSVEMTKGNVPVVHAFHPFPHFQSQHQCSKVHGCSNSLPGGAASSVCVFALVFVRARAALPVPSPSLAVEQVGRRLGRLN